MKATSKGGRPRANLNPTTIPVTTEQRFIVRSIIRNNFTVAWGVFDTQTNQWFSASFPCEYLAQEKANEFNRATAFVTKRDHDEPISR